MTITNHVRAIAELANNIIYHVDHKEYPKAHCDIDELEKRARLCRHHIEHLQLITDSPFVPEED